MNKSVSLNISMNGILQIKDDGTIFINTNNRLEIIGNNSNGSAETSVFFDISSSRGTIDKPEAVQVDDNIGIVSFSGWNGSKYKSTVLIMAGVDDDITSTEQQPGKLILAARSQEGGFKSAVFSSFGMFSADSLQAIPVTEIERDKLSCTKYDATGTIVFNKDTGRMQIYDGTRWRNIILED